MKNLNVKLFVFAMVSVVAMLLMSCKKDPVVASNPLMGYDWVHDSTREHPNEGFTGSLIHTLRFETDSTACMMKEFREEGIFGTHVERHPTTHFKYELSDDGKGMFYGDVWADNPTDLTRYKFVFVYDSVEQRVIISRYRYDHTDGTPVPPYTDDKKCYIFKRSAERTF